MNVKHFTLILGLLFAALTVNVTAQQMQPLPVDPNVRYGKLDNGLTYYVRHNKLPANRADFYIAQNVGSILEEENQRGLAHFLEHMAFNGTEHFPGKSMLNYLESIGVKFGANVNAYTAFDETVYNLSDVPVIRENIVDSCLLILYDWACAISLEDQEIDNERGVIHEEWRTRNDANFRAWDKMVPGMYPGSQYANRMPIGLMEVVDNFPYQDLRDYYHKWYRPDLQGIIVVGDIDADRVEAKIKELFGKIPAPVGAAERIYYPVPDNKEPIVVTSTDKEATSTRITVYYKHDVLPKEIKATPAGLVMMYMQMVTANMLNNRLEELTQKVDAPFLAAGTYDGNYFVSKTKDAFTGVALAKEGEVEKALTALTAEMERVNRYGFTASEYDRARADFLRQIENIYNEREKTKNDRYVNEYVNHFTEGGSISGIETEYQLFNQIAPAITVDQVNKYIEDLLGEDNIVITVNGVEKPGLTYPSKEELLKVFNDTRTADLQPYEDKVSNEPLISDLPKPGKIVKEEKDTRFHTTIWTLSNGAKVILKPTDFKADEILLKASSPGGTLPLDDAEVINIKVIDDAVDAGGLGNFSPTDLQKALAGKVVSVEAEVGERSENVKASCSPKDLETMLQLVYLTFTDPRKDEELFNAWKNRTKSWLENMKANPRMALNDTMTVAMYNNHPRKQNLKAEDLDKVDYDKVLAIYKDRFKDASGFVFTFVGNIQPDSLRPLAERYIASLPSTYSGEKMTDRTIPLRQGAYSNHFTRDMETSKSSVYAFYTTVGKYSPEEAIRLSMLDQIMDIVYTETIREEEGGTYGVGTTSSINPVNNEMVFLLYFDTDPQKMNKLLSLAIAEFKKVAENGPAPETFNKVKEYMLKKRAEDLQENKYWLDQIDFYNLFGIDRFTGYEDLVKKQTPGDIQKAAKAFLKGNLVEVSMSSTPEK